MKSYIQGLITGAVFVFAIFVFIGATGSSEVGKYQMVASDRGFFLFDTQTGAYYKRKSASPHYSGHIWSVNPTVPPHGFVLEE